jgi:hypothetical protein
MGTKRISADKSYLDDTQSAWDFHTAIDLKGDVITFFTHSSKVEVKAN